MMVEAVKRQRKPRSAAYRGAWELVEQWAVRDKDDSVGAEMGDLTRAEKSV